MIDPSKAFDCLQYGLLLKKLDAYGLDDIKSVKLIQQYLSNRKQKVKVGNAYSSWNEIFYSIPEINPWSAYLQYLFCVNYMALEKNYKKMSLKTPKTLTKY